MREIAAILDLLAAHEDSSAVLATLVRVEGSSYRLPGARLLWLPDGTRAGSISGGCLEEEVIERARQVSATGRAAAVSYDTATENDLIWGSGSGCAGRVHLLIEPLTARRPAWIAALRENQCARRDTALAVVHANDPALGTQLADGVPAHPGIFFETIPPPPHLVVFGAGDDARPLVRMARELGWQVTVVDSRAAYATAARFPEATSVLAQSPESVITAVAPGTRSLAVVMTHRFRDDAVLLRHLLAAPLAYLGVLGPRRRTERLLAEIKEAGFAVTPAMLAQLHAPVGLDLGGSSPEAVALAILAEMQCRLMGRTPIHLRERMAPIHG
jgi:xanthine dehydrogenase accessory factor